MSLEAIRSGALSIYDGANRFKDFDYNNMATTQVLSTDIPDDILRTNNYALVFGSMLPEAPYCEIAQHPTEKIPFAVPLMILLDDIDVNITGLRLKRDEKQLLVGLVVAQYSAEVMPEVSRDHRPFNQAARL